MIRNAYLVHAAVAGTQTGFAVLALVDGAPVRFIWCIAWAFFIAHFSDEHLRWVRAAEARGIV